MMSKVTTLLFAFLLAIGLAGCGDSGKEAAKPAAAPAAPATAPADAAKKTEGAMKEEAKKHEGADKPK